jgi:hypothetical protein
VNFARTLQVVRSLVTSTRSTMSVVRLMTASDDGEARFRKAVEDLASAVELLAVVSEGQEAELVEIHRRLRQVES